MRRGFALGLLGLVVALACDDAHKVGEDSGAGGRGGATGGATGGKSAKGGESSTAAAGSVDVGGSPASGGSNVAVGGSPIVGVGGAVGNGGSMSTTGGTTGVGATAGIGGSLGDETCNTRPTQFEFTLDDPTLYCKVSDWCNTIEILTDGGQHISYLGGANCPNSCSTCSNIACLMAACEQAEAGSAPVAGQWNGSFYEASTCGSGHSQCVMNRCVKSGHYVAKYCVPPKGELASCSETDMSKMLPKTACVEVPFDFPSTEVVRGQITKAMIPGAAGAGGAGGTGGTAGKAGVAGGPQYLDETCTWPTAQFEFTLDDPSKYCYAGYWGVPNIEILDADGQIVTRLGPNLCSNSCAACGRSDFGTCITITPTQGDADSAPRTAEWNGAFYPLASCGNSNKPDCTVQRCVQPGHFKARHCMALKGNLSTCTEWDASKFLSATACVEVPFDFPTTEVVRGQITTPATDGAAGASGSGGSGGSAGTAGSAGVPACLPGCNLESKSSSFCPSERSHAWVCGGGVNVNAQMLTAGCTDAATGAIRYCCPSTFQTQCQ